MVKGSYKTENCGAFLLSVIRHSDLKSVNYEAVGKEHGITSHSAYCRFNGIKNAVKAETQMEASTPGNKENKTTLTEVSPSKKRGRKPGSPSKGRGRNAKEEPSVGIQSSKLDFNAAEENGFGKPEEEELLPPPSKKQKLKNKKGPKKIETMVESDEDDWLE